MKKFEVLDHTADIRVKVYGEDEESLFKNAAGMFSSLAVLKYGGEKKETEQIKVSADTLENLMARFLNELVYCAEVKKKAGKLLSAKIHEKNGVYFFSGVSEGRKIGAFNREIKSATYHGLAFERNKGTMSVSIIFDV